MVLFRILCVLVLVYVLVSSHSWVEEATVVDQDGRHIGAAGYARNNGKIVSGRPHMLKLTALPVFRVDGVDVDREMTYKLPQRT